jgi:hypothetical protein
VTVSIFEAVQTRPQEWGCAFRISGLAQEINEFGRGIDSLQALMVAIEGVRFYIERSGEQLTWEDQELGYLGLPRRIPDTFGIEVEQHLVKMVNDEVTRLMAEKAKAEGGNWPPPGGT